MKVLLLSTDQNILRAGSAANARIGQYGSLVDRLDVLVYVSKKNSSGEEIVKIGDNVFAHPVNCRFRIEYFRKAYKLGLALCRAEGIGIISSQDPFETGLVGSWLSRRIKIPLQIQIHTDFLSPLFYRESLKNKVRVQLAKKTLRRADGIRVVSQRISDSLLTKNWSIDTEKITVLPIPVDAEVIKNYKVKSDLRLRYPNCGPIILMAARLTIEKNIDLAIKAMEEVSRTFPKSLLVIVGVGPERERLEKLVEKLNLQNNVSIEPYTDDIISYYKTAQIFVLSSNYEGYGLAPVSAAVAGLPVLMTDVGVAIGKVVPVGDQKMFTEALIDLVGDSQLREDIAEYQKIFLGSLVSTREFLARLKTSWNLTYGKK